MDVVRMTVLLVVSTCICVTMATNSETTEAIRKECDEFLTFNKYLAIPSKDKPVIQDYDRRAAIRFVQSFYHLNITGELDQETLGVMRTARCGCEDVPKEDDIKKTMMMRRPRSVYGPQNYQIAKRGWPENRVTWTISKYSSRDILSEKQQQETMTRAFSLWAEQVQLSFIYVKTPSTETDIDIRFETGFHLPEVEHPSYKFDGEGGKLAHAFPPTSGMVHFDDAEPFDIGNPDNTDLMFTATHEIGHALGLYHSAVEDSIMYPTYSYMESVQLHADDIQGIKALYDGRDNSDGPYPTRPLPRPTRPPTPSPPPKPAICHLEFDAVIYVPIVRRIFVFISERSKLGRHTYVHRLIPGYDNLAETTRYRINELFGPRHPPFVDAAFFIKSNEGERVYVFAGTRLFRYKPNYERTQTSYKVTFSLVDDSPTWLDVTGFPERPRAALALQTEGNGYYTWIFGMTMVCDWDIENKNVGSMCMPSQMFGHNMPNGIKGSVNIEDKGIFLFHGKEYYRFDMARRTIVDGYPRELAPSWIRGECGSADL